MRLYLDDGVNRGNLSDYLKLIKDYFKGYKKFVNEGYVLSDIEIGKTDDHAGFFLSRKG